MKWNGAVCDVNPHQCEVACKTKLVLALIIFACWLFVSIHSTYVFVTTMYVLFGLTMRSCWLSAFQCYCAFLMPFFTESLFCHQLILFSCSIFPSFSWDKRCPQGVFLVLFLFIIYYLFLFFCDWECDSQTALQSQWLRYLCLRLKTDFKELLGCWYRSNLLKSETRLILTLDAIQIHVQKSVRLMNGVISPAPGRRQLEALFIPTHQNTHEEELGKQRNCHASPQYKNLHAEERKNRRLKILRVFLSPYCSQLFFCPIVSCPSW